MKKHDIEAIFTAKVQEYILKGWRINTTTMSGSEGEISKIDLTDGNDIIEFVQAEQTRNKFIRDALDAMRTHLKAGGKCG